MAGPARPELRFLACVSGLLAVSYFAFGGYRNWPYKIESDGKYFYQYLVSAVSDGDLDFANQYRLPKYPWMMTEIDHYGFKERVSPLTTVLRWSERGRAGDLAALSLPRNAARSLPRPGVGERLGA